MLSNTRKTSPARLATGTAGGLALAVAALAVTASGTQAAETIKAKVERATGVDLGIAQDAQQPPAAPQAPGAPQAPAAPDAPDAPEAAEPGTHVYRIQTRTTGQDGDQDQDVIVTRGENGRMRVSINGQVQDIPEVTERRCGVSGENRSRITVRANEGGREVMIICTDRVEAMAQDAEVHAARAAQYAESDREYSVVAMRQAREGLITARAQIVRMPHLSDAERAEALAEVDEAMVELDTEMRSPD